jgi:glycerophosphoryl diester phosphodiesterase
VSEYTLDELKEFDAAYKFTLDGGKSFPFRGKGITFPSVNEILTKFPDQKFNIDLKDKKPEQVKRWKNLIENHNAQGRVLTASQYRANLRLIREYLPEMATCFSAGEVFSFYLRNKFGGYHRLEKKDYRGDALQIPVKMGPLRIVSEKSIENAHKLGYRMHVWTINDATAMKNLFQKGVDAIFTDNPRILKRVINELF